MINFYDFEVFKYNWMVVIINPFEKTVTEIVDDADKLRRYYENHKHEIWSGFNSKHYDQYILKALLCGFDASEISDWIFKKEMPGWKFSSLLNKINLIDYDIRETVKLGTSLKEIEGFQGHNIHETGVDFRIDRPLTKAEIKETIEYCTNDVEEAIQIWVDNKSDFDAKFGLVKMFNLPTKAIGRTKAQITADILECVKVTRRDEWELFTLPCLRLNNARYLTVKRKKNKKENLTSEELERQAVVLGKVRMKPDEWFLNEKYQKTNLFFETDVCGVKHVFGWGGIHGAREKYHYKCDSEHLLLHVDVASYYPSMMLQWKLLTRNSKAPEKYKNVYDTRLKLKHEGKKKEQAPLKIVLNATYGICNDKNSNAFDPRNAHLITINGQLLLLDLLEKLETVPSFELVQSNTDGLIIKIRREDFEQVDDVCYDWECRTKMNLEFDYIKEIAQKDVNNYVFVQFDGKVEKKGSYVKDLSPIDNDLPIVNKAICDYILKRIPPEITIDGCDELQQFQKICKLTRKFDYVEEKRTKRHYNKCYRIFASKRQSDGKIEKVKLKGKNDKIQYFKFENTSDKSFIENGNIEGVKTPSYLDKNFYIDLTYKRLEQYGMKK